MGAEFIYKQITNTFSSPDIKVTEGDCCVNSVAFKYKYLFFVATLYFITESSETIIHSIVKCSSQYSSRGV